VVEEIAVAVGEAEEQQRQPGQLDHGELSRTLGPTQRDQFAMGPGVPRAVVSAWGGMLSLLL
jgi:hypothetical protein